MSAATASANPRATTCTPIPGAGTATAESPNRLQKFVYVPIRAFTPIGSARTSAIVGWTGEVGRSSASASPHSAIASRRSTSRRSVSDTSTCAGMSRARPMIAPTVGSTPSGDASMKAPTAAYRSATNPPS